MNLCNCGSDELIRPKCGKNRGLGTMSAPPIMRWLKEAEDEQDSYMQWLCRNCLTNDVKGEFAKSAIVYYLQQKQSGCVWEIAKYGMCKHGNKGCCDTLGNCKKKASK